MPCESLATFLLFRKRGGIQAAHTDAPTQNTQKWVCDVDDDFDGATP